MFATFKMKRFFKLAIPVVVLLVMSFTTAHKYYVSVTQVEYVEKQKSLQIITRIFIDDIEKLFQERYDENLILAGKDEPVKAVNSYVERYLKSKLVISINGKPQQLTYVGREYEDDIMYIYLEIENVSDIKSFEISNAVLFDLYAEQQNIVRTKIYSKHKSFVLIAEKNKGLLNFN